MNNQTVRMNFPLSNIDDHVTILSNFTLYTILDLAHGYLQIPLSEASKNETAFITPDEMGEFQRMIFDLTNLPFHFSTVMHKVLVPLQGQVVLYNLGDILIPAEN